MPLAEKVAYISRLLTNLSSISIWLVTKAEIKFGGGTGVIKRSYVMDELYSRVPDEYKKFVTEDNLNGIIIGALEEARPMWEQNKDIKGFIIGIRR
jgi:hypothetical protein